SRILGHVLLLLAGDESSLAEVVLHLAVGNLPWLASIAGEDEPDLGGEVDAVSLRRRHSEISVRWLAMNRDVERRGAWGDRVIDELCDPPESFLLSQILADVLTFSAHRRQVARWMLGQSGIDTDRLEPDPIAWQRTVTGGLS